MMKMVVVDPAQYGRKNVPLRLQHAVAVLNQALAIDAVLVTSILDEPSQLDERTAQAFEAHPSIVVRGEKGGRASLTALGLIGGCVNEDPFRLSVTEEDDGTWTKFNVMELVPA